MTTGTWSIEMPPAPNMELRMGDIRIHQRVSKTVANRIKYWLFCQFFPFEIIKWDKEPK